MSLPILVAIGLFMAFIPAIWGKSYYETFTGEYESMIWIIISFTTIISISIYRHLDFSKEIRESNKRMKDKQYSDAMRRLSK